MSENRLFIVGLPRTGSTLLRTLLNKSDRVCLMLETHYLRRISRVGSKKEIAKFGDLHDDRNIDQFVEHLYKMGRQLGNGYWGWLSEHIEPQEFKQSLLARERSEREIFNVLMETFAREKKGALSPDLILGDKTPTNLFYVPTLFEWYPNARVIQTFRDPRAVYVSALKLVKTGRWNWRKRLPPLPEGLQDPMVNAMVALYITRYWLAAVNLDGRYKKLYPGQYYPLKFEDLILEPEDQIRDLCTFLNIPFDEAILTDVAIAKSSYHASHRVYEGFDASAIDRWRNHIDPWVKSWFSLVGRSSLQQYGYSAS